MTTVSDIVRIMENIAPSRLAEDWDNCGLQVGAYSWEIKKIWTALDASPKVIQEAVENNIDMLIVHHPFLFSGIKSLNFDSEFSQKGALIYEAAKAKLAIFSAHTNFDKVNGGLNDILARKLNLKNISVFQKNIKENKLKLVFFVPKKFEEKLLHSLFKTDAGIIGNYSCCSFRSSGVGTFKPGSKAEPFLGKSGEISNEKEVRIETIVKKNNIEKIISALKSSHPYETLVYDIYPLIDFDSENGFGRVGEFEEPLTLLELLKNIKKDFQLDYLRYCGDLNLKIRKLALCSGSGGSFVKYFLRSNCEAYLTGDIKYHEARQIEEKGKAIIDMGHFATEHLSAKYLALRLNKIFMDKKMDIKAFASDLEKEPFKII